MKTFCLFIAMCAGLSAQELTLTLRLADGTTTTRTMSGPAVAAGLQIIEGWRQDQCVEAARPASGCATLRYSSVLDAIRGILVDAIVSMSDRYPTTATASLRAAKAQAEADLAAARKALETAARQ
jgi:hypothetical protein